MEENQLDQYQIGMAKFTLLEKADIPYLLVNEPLLSQEEEEAVERIVSKILAYNSSEPFEFQLSKVINEENLEPTMQEKIIYYIKKRMFYGKLTPFLEDPDIEEIECRGYGYPITVIHRKYPYKRLITNVIFTSEEEIVNTIEKLINRAEKTVSLAKPYAEFSLPEGHRVALTLSNEISIPGSTFDIRKFPKTPLSIFDLLSMKVLTPSILSYIWSSLEHTPFIFIVGATGSGKTTLLNALLQLVNPLSKIVTIEDTPEISLLNSNWVRFVTRTSFDEGYSITLSDLARLALRYRPDYLVIGEVRGREIESLVHASATGHGSLSTFHGAHPNDVITRVKGLLNQELATLFIHNIKMIIVMDAGRRRGVKAIYENFGYRTGFKKVIYYDPMKKEFVNDNFVELLTTSKVIRRIMLERGITEEEMKLQFEEKAKVLSEGTGRHHYTPEDITSMIANYYKSGDNYEAVIRQK
ncbi:type II secretion protein VirB [Sulfolobales archaeon HS-7]|nr:type II secretion protein VirB [Sulfolobales archaeon HS-7]